MKADIKAELKHLIDRETDMALLEAVRALFTQEEIDPFIEREMILQALKSEQDIKEGKVFTLEEAESRLNDRLGL